MLEGRVDMHEAAFSGDVRALKKIIEEQKNPNDKDEMGQTALHKAAMNGWLESVSLLLDNGALPNTTDLAGCTPLHYAAANGYIDIFRYLVESGKANLSLKTNKGHTARHMARTRGHSKMAAFISELENKLEGNSWMNQ